MLGSEHDGERAAAALKADQLVRSRGLTWQQVISVEPTSVESMIDFCLAAEDHLSVWEAAFVRGIRGRQHLTEKQLRKLRELADQVRERRTAP
jgi:hypothetical protein